MSDRAVRRLSRFASQQIWAIREHTLDVIVEVLRMRAAGIELSQEEVRARIGASAPSRSLPSRGAVAVLPLYGVVAPKMTMMTEISGGTSLDAFLAEFRSYRDDPAVGAIVVDVDSPGGSVFGVQEAADEIYASRDAKPTIASVNPECGSAALWIASAFGQVVCTPSGDVGSLGVFMMHEDWSQANERMGVKPTYISAGPYKVEGNPDAPLSDETIAFLQGQVNTIYDTFVKSVAKSRGLSQAKVKSDFGQGRMLLAKDALAVGMIDRIQTFDETVSQALSGKLGSKRAARAAPIAPVASRTPEPIADPEGQDAGPVGATCRACNGSGLKPERFMGDPEGLLPCEACHGTGTEPPPATPEDEAAARDAAIAAEHQAILAALAK